MKIPFDVGSVLSSSDTLMSLAATVGPIPSNSGRQESRVEFSNSLRFSVATARSVKVLPRSPNQALGAGLEINLIAIV